MTANEQDQDVIRWGLDLLDFGPFFNYGYMSDYTQEDGSTCHVQYMKEYNRNTECNSGINCVENDEIIAHTLQEEFSRLEVDDSDGPSHAEAEQFHSSNVSSQSAHMDAQEEINDTRRSNPYDGDDYSYSLELTDESALDGELGKRLDQLVPVPHVPKINGEIPSLDEASSDHQRLLDRLQLYELIERKVQGDGNCQFRSLSDQLYRTLEHHKFVRQQIVHQLKSHREFYEGYVPMEYGEYLKKMSESGEWGDHVTLQAASDSYGVKVFLITSFKSTCYMEIIPRVQKSNRIIFLSFWAEVHYNSLYPHEGRELVNIEVDGQEMVN